MMNHKILEKVSNLSLILLLIIQFSNIFKDIIFNSLKVLLINVKIILEKFDENGNLKWKHFCHWDFFFYFEVTENMKKNQNCTLVVVAMTKSTIKLGIHKMAQVCQFGPNTMESRYGSHIILQLSPGIKKNENYLFP